jgi:hypothetical protein
MQQPGSGIQPSAWGYCVLNSAVVCQGHGQTLTPASGRQPIPDSDVPQKPRFYWALSKRHAVLSINARIAERWVKVFNPFDEATRLRLPQRGTVAVGTEASVALEGMVEVGNGLEAGGEGHLSHALVRVVK